MVDVQWLCNESQVENLSEVLFWTAVQCIPWQCMNSSKEMADVRPVQWMCKMPIPHSRQSTQNESSNNGLKNWDTWKPRQKLRFGQLCTVRKVLCMNFPKERADVRWLCALCNLCGIGRPLLNLVQQ